MRKLSTLVQHEQPNRIYLKRTVLVLFSVDFVVNRQMNPKAFVIADMILA